MLSQPSNDFVTTEFDLLTQSFHFYHCKQLQTHKSSQRMTRNAFVIGFNILETRVTYGILTI